ARTGQAVVLWCRREEQARALCAERTNAVYLPGVPFPDGVSATADLAEALRRCDDVLLAVPAQSLRALAEQIAPHLRPAHRFLSLAKGLEIATGLRMSQVLAAVLPVAPERIAALSGPNHAEEVGRGLPTAGVVASAYPPAAEHFQALLMNPSFRLYTNPDLAGVELAGALKNVIALATGIADGLGFGDNSRAALITRGLAEIGRLGQRLGAQPLTFAGLAGMGDLIATCTSRHSRNARAGRLVGEGASIAEVTKATPMAIEGVPTTRAAIALARRAGVEMPICQAVYDVLFQGVEPRSRVDALMRREARTELDALS
ncbi:MAG TPA: NAD(P)H-dependent glycerol-3-phosphate dehydrogenase, partial [Limnochordia bacterium]|nr:NAD(P)H-dependent glycerol-3-phosphate dehydrogenase [Limnochordia bacterium]